MSDKVPVPWYTTQHNVRKSSSIEEFRWFVRERQRITKLKNAGAPWPWTKDEVLQRFHFCNIDRAEDRGTKYIVNKLGRLQDGPTLVFNVMLARFFNRPELMKKTKLTHVQTEQALCEFSKYRRLKDGRSNGRNRRYHGPAREQH